MESDDNDGDTSAGIMMFRFLWSLGYSAQNYRIAPKQSDKWRDIPVN